MEEPPDGCSQRLHHFLPPSAMFRFSHIVTSTFYLFCFVVSIPGAFEVVSHCGFDLHFSDD